MRKYSCHSIVILSLFTMIFVGCSSPTVKERITDKGAKVNIKSSNGKYLSSNWDRYIYADKDKASTWEEFDIFLKEEGKYVIQAHTGKYFSADLGDKQQIQSNRDRPSTWETFEIVDINDSTIAIKAFNNKYINVASDMKLYAVADTITANEHFVVTFKQQEQ